MSQFFRVGVFLLAVNFLVENIPGIMPQLSRFIGLLMLGVLVGLYFPRRILKSHLNTAILTGFMLLASLALLLQGGFPTLLGLAIFVFALEILLRNAGEYKHDLTALLLTISFYISFVILYRFTSPVWYLLQNISLPLSRAVTSIIRQKITLSATAIGMPITILLLCYCISAFLLAQRRNFYRFLLAVATVILVNIVYLWLQKPLTMLANLVNRQWRPNAFDFQILLLFLLMGPVYLMTKASKFREIPLGFSTLSWRYVLPAVILLFFACLTLIFPLNGKRESGTVVLYSRGHLNWNSPVFGKYGQNSIGMFGLLPKYLELGGYQTKKWDKPLTEKVLQDAKIMVIMNLTKFLSNEEKQSIWRFIQNGGSLLILGEHTNVMGASDKLNDLMQPFKISLNFDSALPLRTGWGGCLEKRPHPITAHLFDDREAAIWVGSSLSISPPAQPVIIGKRGWADHGNRHNRKRAFLGDYKRSSDEQLGDVILVASSHYGKGKVLVFGDTSTFQNGALMISYQFVYQIFDWLAKTGDSPNIPIRVLIALLFLIPTGYLLIKKISMSITFILSCILIVSAALAIASIFRTPRAEIHSHLRPFSGGTGRDVPHASSDTSKILFKPAYIDTSHLERYSRVAASDNSIWGLSMNLARNGYLPMVMRQFGEQALSSSQLFVVIAPTKKFSSHEIDVLTQFMRSGGIVIWSVGWEEGEASNSFLKKFNFSIDSVPLGPAETFIRKQKVKFFEAWPVVGGSKQKRVIAQKWDYPIIVYEPISKGGLLVIGDSGFLLSKNLESYQKNYKKENILFLYYLFKQLKASQKVQGGF